MSIFSRRVMRSLLGVLLAVLAVGLGTELLLRGGIALGLAHLDNPGNYVDPYCDEDYHKLRFLWGAQGALRSGRNSQHPRYGWVPVGPGMYEPGGQPGGYQPNSIEGPRIAIFGDSFVAGVDPTLSPERISSQLAELLPRGIVADYSGVGYGLGQIYMRFSDVLASPDQKPDLAIVGIFLGDIDRVVERFRAGPKPYFELRDDSLVLKGVPITVTPEEWLNQNPPEIRSFSLALVRRRIDRLRGLGGGPEADCRRTQKRQIAQRLIQRMINEAAAVGTELVFLPIFGVPHLSRTSWREDFLRSTFDEEGATYLDTKAVFIQAGRAESGGVGDFYYPPPNGHFNNRGNALVAETLFEHLAGIYGWQQRPTAPAISSRIAMGRLGNWSRSQDRGWGLHGDHFSWMVEPRATVRFSGFDSRKPISVVVEVMRALTTDKDPRRLRVLANGELVREISLSELPEKWQSFLLEVPIDPRLVEDSSELSLSLELDFLLSPAAMPDSGSIQQSRGIAVKSLTLETGG